MGLFGGKDKPAPPGGNHQARAGWYEYETYERWWTGDSWQDAFRTSDGRVDASRCIRQAVVQPPDGGSWSDQRAILRALRRYPPARIVGVTTTPGPVTGRMMPLFVIEWD